MAMEQLESAPVMPVVLFREIHKNSFLKRLCSSEKRTGFTKRSEKVWAVFCVHDDTEAFLELYPDHKVALSHKPDWFISLRNALHVSPSIVGQGDEFEFAVTLPTQVVRLAAASWESMMEWVDTVRNKLRELRVLAPKENLYSKMPEPRHILLPTRDPTSPLPLPPVGPSGILPGVECPRIFSNTNSGTDGDSSLINEATEPTSHSNGSRALNSNNDIVGADGCETEAELPPIADLTLSAVVVSSRLESTFSSQSYNPCSSQQSGSSSAMNEGRNENTVAPTSGSSMIVVNDDSTLLHINTRAPALLPTDSLEGFDASPSLPENSSRRLIRAVSAPSGTNVTVIKVPPPMSSHYEPIFPSSSDSSTKLERLSSNCLIPRLPAKASRESDPRANKSLCSSPQTSQESDEVAGPSLLLKQKNSPQHTSVVTVKPNELIAIAVKGPPKETAVVRVAPGANRADASHNGQAAGGQASRPTGQAAEVVMVPPMPAAFQPAPTGLNVRDIPLIGGHQRRRRRSSSSDAGPVLRGLVGADLIRVPAEAPEAPVDAPRRTLRESQVCQLRREMSHQGGVRLPLRRKDCVGAIALVDISNAVWVAGWKQREHPMLYNALHIGDRVVSVGDVPVHTAADAQKLLRGVGGPTVELVVRRLPRGVVLALQRPRGAGDVGLIPDATAVAEVTVVPGGAAARSGLPQRTTTMDGLSLTSWTITEINGRPLNLFCKPSEITTRLNSVGKELSVLVQPSDFIKQVRKQLKAVRGYKEYLLL